MHPRKCFSIAAWAVAFVLATTSCRPSQTLERQTDDAAIEAKIKTKLATDVGPATITSVEVNVTNGVVTLAGPVKSADDRQKIEAVAKRVPLEANPATAHMFIMKPFTGGGLMALFSTHPPTEQRVAALLGTIR